jgi:hypothetical protein
MRLLATSFAMQCNAMQYMIMKYVICRGNQQDCNAPVTSGGAAAAASTEGKLIGSAMTAVAASSSIRPLTTCVERFAGAMLA